MVVSGNASVARLSHEAANAGAAVRHARTHGAHFIAGIFILASRSKSVYTLWLASPRRTDPGFLIAEYNCDIPKKGTHHEQSQSRRVFHFARRVWRRAPARSE